MKAVILNWILPIFIIGLIFMTIFGGGKFAFIQKMLYKSKRAKKDVEKVLLERKVQAVEKRIDKEAENVVRLEKEEVELVKKTAVKAEDMIKKRKAVVNNKQKIHKLEAANKVFQKKVQKAGDDMDELDKLFAESL